jgi:AcrR family transcriptional regulator
MLDERFAEELDRLDERLSATEDPIAGAQAAALDFVAFAGAADWSRLYFQFAAHAARSEEFRHELARHHQAMRARLTEIFARRRKALGIDSPVATEDVAAMICAMADGFLVDRMIDPELKPELYAQMVGVFLAGLAGLAGVSAGELRM